jgi:hypothetical protein
LGQFVFAIEATLERGLLPSFLQSDKPYPKSLPRERLATAPAEHGVRRMWGGASGTNLTEPRQPTYTARAHKDPAHDDHGQEKAAKEEHQEKKTHGRAPIALRSEPPRRWVGWDWLCPAVHYKCLLTVELTTPPGPPTFRNVPEGTRPFPHKV